MWAARAVGLGLPRLDSGCPRTDAHPPRITLRRLQRRATPPYLPRSRARARRVKRRGRPHRG
eukprot:728648-Prymnesium_polylepis.1